MFDRIASAALVIAAATAVYAQTDKVKHTVSDRTVTVQERQVNHNDPFAISSGSTFAASTSSKKKIDTNVSRTLAVSISTDVEDALSIIKQNHVDGRSTNTNDLAKSSINSMLKSLDPHSNYYDAAEYRELIGDQKSEYFGTGSTIISYTREDRMVKQAFLKASGKCQCPPRIPQCICGATKQVEILTKKPITAGDEELDLNPRSRSAKLRAVRKLG